MPEFKHRARARERPVLPDPPFLCSSCRHGTVIGQKLQPWLLEKEPWQNGGPDWFWQARCASPKVTPWKFRVFCHPIVECDGYRPRKVLTTEDVARKEARKAKRARKRRKKKREKRSKKNKKK